jgi:hypothetical protein
MYNLQAIGKKAADLTREYNTRVRTAFVVLGLVMNSPEHVNPLKPELNPSAQHCLTRFFTRDFAS